MKPSNRTGSVFNPSTASEEDIVAALVALYDRELFNEYDSSILDQICEAVLDGHTINTRQISLVRAKLQRYWKIIPELDLEASRVPFKVQAFVAGSMKPAAGELRTSVYNDEYIKLEFGFDESLINRVKSISGRMYHREGNVSFWTIPISPINIKMLINMGFPIPKQLQNAGSTYEGELDFTGLKKELRPYQIQGVERAAGELDLNALIADEMGLGKTAQALVCLWVRRQETFPALVMCPGSLKWNWAKEINLWLPDTGIRILEGLPKRGRTAFRPRQEQEITIVNWEILANRGDWFGWAKLLKDSGFQTVILDECQDIKNHKAKRTIAVTDVCNKVPNVLALSGTPIESRPSEFYPVLKIVAPDLFPNWHAFAKRYCGRPEDGYKGATNTKELNQILTDRVMIRRMKTDVLKDLPPKQRQVIPVDIDMKEYRKEENELRSYLQRSKNEPAQSRNAEGLARIERCKQAAIRGKLNLAIDYIENYLSSSKKLVVFAVHMFTMDALEKHFSSRCVRIDGTTSGIKKQQATDRFQGDDDVRLIIATIKPGGRGHTWTAASDTLTLEFEWTPGKHDQAEDRVHRIGQEADSVRALYMVASGTIEEDIMELIDTKRSVLSQVLDGKEVKEESMLKYLMKKYGG